MLELCILRTLNGQKTSSAHIIAITRGINLEKIWPKNNFKYGKEK